MVNYKMYYVLTHKQYADLRFLTEDHTLTFQLTRSKKFTNLFEALEYIENLKAIEVEDEDYHIGMYLEPKRVRVVVEDL